jgi:IS5 family transposase
MAEAIAAERSADDEHAASRRAVAGRYQALRDAYRERAAALATAADDRAVWEDELGPLPDGITVHLDAGYDSNKTPLNQKI